MIDVKYSPGAGLTRLFELASIQLQHKNYDVLYVMGGNITSKVVDKPTRIYAMKTMDQEENASRLLNLITEGITDISTTWSNLTIIILPIVGVELNRYNKLDGISEHQKDMDYTITRVNRMITDDNNMRGYSTPGIASLVHRCKGRKTWSHRYKYLNDGCHFTDELKTYCIQQIVKSVTLL